MRTADEVAKLRLKGLGWGAKRIAAEWQKALGLQRFGLWDGSRPCREARLQRPRPCARTSFHPRHGPRSIQPGVSLTRAVHGKLGANPSVVCL